jgi:hypothetical protein
LASAFAWDTSGVLGSWLELDRVIIRVKMLLRPLAGKGHGGRGRTRGSPDRPGLRVALVRRPLARRSASR